ncbi:MAG: pyridoxamine 5'-phosphate oxidase family protein [Enhydrobacter sp.]|nr:MAG: pyridoxamine 5'-phosphate oxidase family protein [Enhydrobacter sp.]
MPDSAANPAAAPAAPAAPDLLDDAGARALVESYAPVGKGAALKDIGRVDRHMARFIALSPLCLVATADRAGRQDVTPRGDPPGSFKVLGERTVAIADRPGNNRLDTLRNLLENPEIALIFLIPGIAETVRLAGTARLSVDAALLESMAVQGKAPKCAIVVEVRQAYLHCAKALLRSRLWEADHRQPRGTFPSISRIVGEQIGLSEADKAAAEARTERAYRDGLWAPIQ